MEITDREKIYTGWINPETTETVENVEGDKSNNWKLTVQEMLDKNEEFKKKGLQLNEDDLFNRLILQDDMITESSNQKGKYLENKLQIDKDKALRSMELKAEVDEKGKAMTDKQIEARLKQEFYEKDLDQTVLKASYELLYQRAQTITEFINIVKMNSRKIAPVF